MNDQVAMPETFQAPPGSHIAVVGGMPRLQVAYTCSHCGRALEKTAGWLRCGTCKVTFTGERDGAASTPTSGSGDCGKRLAESPKWGRVGGRWQILGRYYLPLAMTGCKLPVGHGGDCSPEITLETGPSD